MIRGAVINHCKNVIRLFSKEAIKLETRSKANIGQPTPESHPHLLKNGEVMAGFTLKEITSRRDSFVKEIQQNHPNGNHLVVISSATTQYMTEKIPYVFRQNTDFKYLTGCLEPDCALLLTIDDSGSYRSTLVVREKSKHTDLWEGTRTGVDEAVHYFGVDEACSINEFKKVLFSKMTELRNFTLWYSFQDQKHSIVHNAVSSSIVGSGTKEIQSPTELIHKLRVIKSPAEQSLMRRSAEIASDAILKTMDITRVGMTEHQLFATVDYHCRMASAEILAYPPVVASGNNANIIHYIHNTQLIGDGQLVLMDAGCEYRGYCSDITRTWPANGTFSEHQKTLYEIILSIQKDLIAKCCEEVSLDDLLREMTVLLGRRLKEAHVIKEESANDNLEAVASKLCPHHVGHYLGMDVHDTATVSRQIPLQQGMVITIEPGIYISEDNKLTHSEFRGCGIRIEDDILITSSGPDVLSKVPKTINDIEMICKH